MLEIGPKAGGAGGAGASDLVANGTDASFMVDVVEESKRRPVIVDFWAEWCGPCRQLGPSLEKAVGAAKGAVKLIKIDIDKNPRIAGQLRVQSIPAVYAFVNGQPVDGFMGALPDSQVQAFVDRLVGGEGEDEGAADIEGLLALAAESWASATGGAAQAYAEILQLDPENVKAIAGLARCYLTGGDVERAAEVAAMAPEGAKDAELDSVRAALALAEQAAGETAQFEKRLAADPDDHEARIELSKILAGRGDLQAAVDHLLTVVEKDRAFGDDAARKQLLTVLEAAGPGSDIAKTGRRRLSSLLFS